MTECAEDRRSETKFRPTYEYFRSLPMWWNVAVLKVDVRLLEALSSKTRRFNSNVTRNAWPNEYPKKNCMHCSLTGLLV